MDDLPFQTVTQFVALGLTLIAGWFLGLASSSGGRKWRERYRDEELSSAGYRDRAETDLRDAAKRIRDLEDENARLRAATVAAPEVPLQAAAPVVSEPAIAPAPVRAEPEGHSTATVVGAAVAGAVAGAAVTHAVETREPSPASEARPAYAEPVQTAPAPEPLQPEPTPAQAVDADPVVGPRAEPVTDAPVARDEDAHDRRFP